MVQGALSEQDFRTRIQTEPLSPDTPIVPYCTVGYRSGLLCEKLAEEGFTNLYNGQGVILWSYSDVKFVKRKNQGKDEDSEEETDEIHVYGPTWDYVNKEKYKSITFSRWSQWKEGTKNLFK